MLLFLGSSAWKFVALGLSDIFEKGFVELVLVFDVCIGCSVREIAFPATACEIPALGILSLSTAVPLLHKYNIHLQETHLKSSANPPKEREIGRKRRAASVK